jgi:hypothetical protein
VIRSATIFAATTLLGVLTHAEAARADDFDCTSGGYAGERLTYQPLWVNAPIPPKNYPEGIAETELNVQPKCKSDTTTVYADFSAFLTADGFYKSVNEAGDTVASGVPARQRTIGQGIVNEVYAAKESEGGLAALLGKKRVVWGSGFSFNPTDLLNPAKDPSEPATQRSGAWLGQLEDISAARTLTLLASPETSDRLGGMPETWQKQHYLFGARAYSLLAGTDVNLMVYDSNLYHDRFQHKLRYGASAARFFGALGFHGEVLLTKGSDRLYADPACTKDEAAIGRCQVLGHPALGASRIDDARIYAKALVGVRYHFEDDAQFIMELLHQDDGYTKAEFQNLATLAGFAQENGQTLPLGSGVAVAAQPQMKNYLVVHYGDYKVTDDFGLNGEAIANLQQQSGYVGPGLSYSPSASVQVTVRYLELVTSGQGAEIPGSAYTATETELAQMQRQLMVWVRAFY